MKSRLEILFIIASIILIKVFYLSAGYSYFFQKYRRGEDAEIFGGRVVFDINTQLPLDKNRERHKDKVTSEYVHPDAKIAIIITGLGLSKHLVDKAIMLPRGVVLGFSPYAENIEMQLDDDKNEHEVCLNIPVGSDKYPESHQALVLNDKVPVSANKAKLEKLFASTKQKPECVYTNEDDQYTKNIAGAKMLLDAVKENNMVLIYGAKSSENYLNQEMSNNHGSVFQVDSHIDAILSQREITSQLEALVDKAHAQGYAVGVAGAYPITMDTINNWSKTLPELKVELVPISEIYDR